MLNEFLYKIKVVSCMQSLVMVHYLFKELVSNQVIIGGLLLAQQLEKLHGA
jgi:hypothetical protein